jgi:hypothetical protein
VTTSRSRANTKNDNDAMAKVQWKRVMEVTWR